MFNGSCLILYLNAKVYHFDKPADFIIGKGVVSHNISRAWQVDASMEREGKQIFPLATRCYFLY